MTDAAKLGDYDRLVQQVAELRRMSHTAETLAKRLRELAPAWCCEHTRPPCLECGLAWLVANDLRVPGPEPRS